MPTMDDVARASGFSQMTVTRAYLPSALIRRETKQAILKAAAEIGYFYNKAASVLASNNSRAFGIIVPTLEEATHLPFVEGARQVFERESFEFFLKTIGCAREREPIAIASLLSLRVRAILLPSIEHTRRTLTLLDSVPMPLIEFGNVPRRPRHYAVGYSDHEAAYIATRHLIAIGRRRIAIICRKPRFTADAHRLNGFRQAMADRGIAIPEGSVAEIEGSVSAGLEGLKALTDSGQAFDGLVVADETWTAAILVQLVKSGVGVPNQVAVVGIGDVEIAQYLPVPLTCVALPRYQTGALSAELAISLSRGEEVATPLRTLPVELVLRASA